MKKSVNSRSSNEINASSTADIAFLLLIFFLVTTTIFNDQGILTKLPQYDPDPVTIDLSKDAVLTVRLNGQNALSVEEQSITVEKLRKITKEFITARTLIKKESQAIISLHHDRSTNYSNYIAVYNELKAAYNELWEEVAQDRHHAAFAQLSKTQQSKIKKEIPMIISEAEPTDYFSLND